MKQKVNIIITSYQDGDGNRKDNNDISFNDNSVVHTSTQIPNNIKMKLIDLTIILINSSIQLDRVDIF